MRWEVTLCGQLRDLSRVGTSNTTYISEFGCGGRFVVGRFEVRTALLGCMAPWGGAVLWDERLTYLVEEGLYG